jgi:hypothetical protein
MWYKFWGRSDLVILFAHEEGRVEHFLFGRSNEEDYTQDTMFNPHGET